MLLFGKFTSRIYEGNYVWEPTKSHLRQMSRAPQIRNEFKKPLVQLKWSCRNACVRTKLYAENIKNVAVNESIDSKDGEVVIVGGGPAGMGVALMLAKRGWKNITLLEKRSSAQFYEPEKAYQYLIDARGQQFTDYMNFTQELEEVGVPSSQATFTQVKSDGSMNSFPINMNNAKRQGYWMPRRVLLGVLHNKLQKFSDQVKIQFSTNCIDLVLDQEQEKIEITYSDDRQRIHKLQPTLLIGCDGANSIVRNKLFEKSKNGKFALKEFPSPATGLRFKIMTMPPNFVLNKETGEKAVSNRAYAIQSVSKVEGFRIRMGCLPFKDAESPRTANFIAKPSHHIWTLKTGEELLNYLEEQFPLVSIKEQVPMEELDRVAKSQGGKFPAPTYSEGVQLQFGKKGVVLMGDALHFFPPDLGQGVNSSFEDVVVFEKVLEKCDDNVVDALPLFEQMRLEDSKSLVKLVQVVAPYQYAQDAFGQQIWFLFLGLEILANKLLPAVFSSTTFFKMNNPEMSYTDILNAREENLGRLRLAGVLIGAVVITAAMLGFQTIVV